MKSCPTCKRTFEDTFTFCLIDGSVLSAPFDPAARSVDQSAREPDPPRTEVLRVAASSETLQETRAAPPPANLQPTITSPFSPQPIAQEFYPPAPSSSSEVTPDLARWMFIVRGSAAILVGLLLLLLKVSL